MAEAAKGGAEGEYQILNIHLLYDRTGSQAA